MQPCPQCQIPNPPQATFCNRCGCHLRSLNDPFLDRILGKYQLKEQIGGGGFGMVYRAEHVELGNPFAVKILHPHFSGQEAMVERFRREARLLASLRHENIVQIIDFGFVQSLGFYLVMEWLEGQTLHHFVKTAGLPSRNAIASIFEHLLGALHYAHAKGIIHRDLKPENLLLLHGMAERRTLKILDFGVARMLDEQGEKRLTETGLAVGTPRYMSPEQAVGDVAKIDHRTDLYACGVLLTELLTGRPPFSGSTNDILLQHIERPPPFLRDLAPGLPFSEDLERVVQRALAKSPLHRFATGADFAFALLQSFAKDNFQGGFPEMAVALKAGPSMQMAWPPAGPSLSSHPVSSNLHPSRSGGHLPLVSGLRPTAALPVSASQPSLPPYGSQPSLPGYPSQLRPSDFGSSSPDSETRSLTAAPASAVPMPLESLLAPLPSASPSEPRSTGDAWKGEKHSSDRSRASITPPLSISNQRTSVLWSTIGIFGGLVIASIFFVLGSQQRSTTPPPPLASGALPQTPIVVSRFLPPPPGFSVSLPPPPVSSTPSLSKLPPSLPPSLPSSPSSPSSPSKLPALSRVEPSPRPSSSLQEPQTPPKQREPPSGVPTSPTTPPPPTPSRPDERSTSSDGPSITLLPAPPPEQRSRKSRKERKKSRRSPSPRLSTSPGAAKETTVLHLHTIPAGATIFLDKVDSGKTPKSLFFRKGQKITIRLKKDGFLSHQFVWQGSDEETKKIRLAEDIF